MEERMSDFSWFCGGILVVAILLLIFSGLRIIQEYERGIVFRLGRVVRNIGAGLNCIIPGIEQLRKVDIRTMTVPIERQETITKDSVTVKIDAVLWYRIISPARAILSVADYRNAVHQVALTSLRNIVGQHVLDEVLKERDSINHTLQRLVDDATEPWGVKVEAVEMKDVEIPVSMQRAMAREAEAMREKRARIIKAEAELESSEKLSQGAQRISESPMALELRRMQMISEVGAEQNSTTIILMPSDFVTLAKDISQRLSPAQVASQQKTQSPK
jgi:regulator of protease activity HflC (stomatin/prohibitin superfamily)